MSQEMKVNPNSPEAILNRHLAMQPSLTMSASIDKAGEVIISVSAPGNLSDLSFLLKCLEVKVNRMIDGHLLQYTKAAEAPSESNL